ncbi:hypothetical protein F4859DRAFT_468267 [Xylaria cf. heliscus]|nr:hypothetical protein F4859DRAFT_468267 [Xylaria cf. heliscus]
MKPDFIYSSLLSLVLVSGVDATSKPHQPNDLKTPLFLDTLRALSKTVHRNNLLGRDTKPKNATSIAKSWNGATLFSREPEVGEGNTSISAGIEVTCVTCYVKGLVTTELDFASDFNIIQAIANFTEDIEQEIENVTEAAFDYLKEELPEVFTDLAHFDFDDIDFPPLDISFNVDVPDIPECRLHFQFDDLELYMLVDTVLSAGTMYTLNLYSSNTPIGLSKDSDTFVGIIVSIDLMLGVDVDIDISSGLHIKVHDGMALDLSLFGQNVSSVTFNGASFEFLPVTVQSAAGIMTARLRVGMHAGISEEFDPFELLPVSTGAEVSVFADLAEFTTNITAVPEGDDSGCQLRVQQAYQFALGAAAGASFAIGEHTWGPDISTNTPIFYTTLADVCAESVTKTASAAVIAAPTSIVAVRADEDMTTTTLTDKVTFTGLTCLSSLSECPVSLQSTTRVTSTRTLVVTVPSGSEATFPPTAQNGDPKTIPFSKNIKAVAATTGAPVSYIPPPPPPPSTTADSGGHGGESNGESPAGKASVNKPLIIGLSVGLGVPFLAIVIGGIFFLSKRRKYSAVVRSEVLQVHADDIHSPEKKPATTVMSVGRPGGS